jgi:hypothetical protein
MTNSLRFTEAEITALNENAKECGTEKTEVARLPNYETL